jgi:hypothetical protein
VTVEKGAVVMSHDPLGASGRRHRRRRKLGPDARCIACGESNPTVLIRANRSLFEHHHVLGTQHVPDLTVPVCRNHHAILSAAQVDDGVRLDPQPTVLERLVAIFHAFASFLGSLAKILIEWAMKGHSFIAGLDADFPGWRTKPWAS